jgi:hypothetical protein
MELLMRKFNGRHTRHKHWALKFKCNDSHKMSCNVKAQRQRGRKGIIGLFQLQLQQTTEKEKKEE